jgi:hypothetical protein
MRQACESALGARFNAALNMTGYPHSHQLYGEDTAGPEIHPREALALRFRSGMPEVTVLNPEALLSGADAAVEALKGHIPQSPLRELMITRFSAAMNDLGFRDRPVIGHAARRARILALGLAAEGVPASGASWETRFIRIAATVTWLEMRYAGEIGAPETIVLAVE